MFYGSMFQFHFQIEIETYLTGYDTLLWTGFEPILTYRNLS